MGGCLSYFTSSRRRKPRDLESGQVDVADPQRLLGSETELRQELEPKTIYIAVMGATGSGKTTFINTASGSELRVGMGLESCTNEVQMSQAFLLDKARVILVDTPGFDDTTKSDTDVLKMIAAYLQTMHKQDKLLSGVIYMHRISDIRVGGTSRRDFTMFQELCGQEAYKNVLMVTNMWGDDITEDALAREKELREKDIFFKPILDNGARLLRHMNDQESAHKIIQKLTGIDPVVLRIQSELAAVNDITQTGAYAQLNRELMEQAERNRQELEKLRVELEEAAQAQDEETRIELQEESEKMEAELLRVQNEAAMLASEYQAELRRIEEQLHARGG
ncbi:P-loop containing nucleoside triphosphate hydrolase protein [Suillus clintonianus]|uniref:P-loop containing nucleoside triphosphate hydrolase protein n=1 Tax=Suillus clintonianus TaxID=1904413 RepID=UPI001B881C6C|nr:P-loop containing nucleoside triphosphate hydrolase protein [Suillus clintonianus]KAG2147598.1 P-loop containing nucleoside triphosphate hydrolase protein [Suillus clintonianus]